jgi:hypothetical protein
MTPAMWSACNKGHPSLTFSRRQRVALTGTTKPAWKPCCERLCGHERVMAAVVACGSVSGRGGGGAQPTERSQKRALKSSKNSLTVGCCQGSYTTQYTHISLISPPVDSLLPPPFTALPGGEALVSIISDTVRQDTSNSLLSMEALRTPVPIACGCSLLPVGGSGATQAGRTSREARRHAAD